MEPVDLLIAEDDAAPLQVTLEQAWASAIEPGFLSAKLMQHGSMQVRWYVPGPLDPQLPHDRDELYVIMSGRAVFLRARQSAPFGADDLVNLRGFERVEVRLGDVLFVGAGTEHRFESISADFGAWMIFYGPEGGE